MASHVTCGQDVAQLLRGIMKPPPVPVSSEEAFEAVVGREEPKYVPQYPRAGHRTAQSHNTLCASY